MYSSKKVPHTHTLHEFPQIPVRKPNLCALNPLPAYGEDTYCIGENYIRTEEGTINTPTEWNGKARCVTGDELTPRLPHTDAVSARVAALCCASVWDSCWGCHWTQSVTQRLKRFRKDWTRLSACWLQKGFYLAPETMHSSSSSSGNYTVNVTRDYNAPCALRGLSQCSLHGGRRS